MDNYITENELRKKLHGLVEHFLEKLQENDRISQVAILLEEIRHGDGFGITHLGGSSIRGPQMGRNSGFGFYSTLKEVYLKYPEISYSAKFTRASREFLDELKELKEEST